MKKTKKLFKCVKCGQEKNKEEGRFFLEGTAFCCYDCCGREEKKDKNKGICKFC